MGLFSGLVGNEAGRYPGDEQSWREALAAARVPTDPPFSHEGGIPALNQFRLPDMFRLGTSNGRFPAGIRADAEAYADSLGFERSTPPWGGAVREYVLSAKRSGPTPGIRRLAEPGDRESLGWESNEETERAPGAPPRLVRKEGERLASSIGGREAVPLIDEIPRASTRRLRDDQLAAWPGFAQNRNRSVPELEDFNFNASPGSGLYNPNAMVEARGHGREVGEGSQLRVGFHPGTAEPPRSNVAGQSAWSLWDRVEIENRQINQELSDIAQQPDPEREDILKPKLVYDLTGLGGTAPVPGVRRGAGPPHAASNTPAKAQAVMMADVVDRGVAAVAFADLANDYSRNDPIRWADATVGGRDILVDPSGVRKISPDFPKLRIPNTVGAEGFE